MKKLFWGFFFIYLNFNLGFNGHNLNILPDFVGYYLLIAGAKKLQEERRFFQGVRPFAVGMAVYTAVLWVGALLNVEDESDWLTGILSLIAMAAALYISWVLVQGVLEMEIRRSSDFNGAVLHKYWKGLFAFRIADKVLYWITNWINVSILLELRTVIGIASLIVVLLYLVAWWKGAKLHEALEQKTAIGPELE